MTAKLGDQQFKKIEDKMDQPAWLALAWAEFGVREVAGAGDAPAVLGYFREAGHEEIVHDATPWCAAFAGAMLQRAGCKGTGSLLARSYLDWGDAIDEARIGAIVVLSRGGDANAGHVGFFVGAAANRVFLLGGNQFGGNLGDAVCVGAFDAGRVLGYRWPVDAAPEPTAAKPVAKSAAAPVATAETSQAEKSGGIFATCLAHVLDMEGGYSNDPYDPGGPTNKGITLTDFAKWRRVTPDATSRARLIADLKNISDATVSDIYRSRYWQPASCALLPDAIAVMHFDAAVNHGTGGAARLLQAALGIAIDGDAGPQTLNAARTQSSRSIIERYAELRRGRYRALPHFWRFGRGWMRRVDATETLALRLAADVTLKTETAKGTTNMSNDFKFPQPGQIPGEPMPGEVASGAIGKWWPQSKTVWGALITAVTTVLPVVGPLLGINISADMIKMLGDQTIVVVQAAGGLLGTLLTIYGRSQAKGPLLRGDVKLRV